MARAKLDVSFILNYIQAGDLLDTIEVRGDTSRSHPLDVPENIRAYRVSSFAFGSLENSENITLSLIDRRILLDAILVLQKMRGTEKV